jgi:hypothetical protein
MIDATLSRARMRDLACLGRFRGCQGRVRGSDTPVRFTRSVAPQGGQLAPRADDFVASII